MIQNTNIEKIIEENLPKELEYLDKKISEAQETLSKLLSRKSLLINIGVAAGVYPQGNLRDSISERNSTRPIQHSESSTEDAGISEQQILDPATAAFRANISKFAEAGRGILDKVGVV